MIFLFLVLFDSHLLDVYEHVKVKLLLHGMNYHLLKDSLSAQYLNFSLGWSSYPASLARSLGGRGSELIALA